jgi:hypothetical protein
MNQLRHLDHLRVALDRARQRVTYCRAELEQFDYRAHPANIMLDRPRAWLVEDLRKAELDAAWAEIALADASSPMEVQACAREVLTGTEH